MDTLFSVVASDIISRLISSLITKYKNMNTADKLERLQWLLLRARTIVEEAHGRQISNQGMLLQLRQLMHSMYQGYYILNTFQEQHITGKRTQSLKLKKLQAAMEGLEAAIDDMKEFIVFLLGCPCLPQRPYDTHLFMEKCMFGRHEEKELIRDFLRQPCDSLRVLPIIGPREVGKNTLIEHVCNEESVREHFSRIVRFKSDDLNNQENENFIKGMELVASSIMCLVVVELVNDDISDEAWRGFCSSIDSGCSKMIVISRSETNLNVGDNPSTLKLKRLNQHEFWYFFRTLAFGSANPEDHPELLCIARRIATQIKGAFIAANIFARLLRANLNAKFWRYTWGFIKKAVELQLLVCGEHSWDIVSNSRHYYLSGHRDGPLHLCNDGYKTVTGCLVNDELPKIIADDMLIRTNAFYEGSFDILRWKSPIPPYYCYMANCVVKKAPQIVPKDKSLKRRRGI